MGYIEENMIMCISKSDVGVYSWITMFLKTLDRADDPGVTLTYFTARSNLVTLAFSIGKSENSGFFRNYCSQ